MMKLEVTFTGPKFYFKLSLEMNNRDNENRLYIDFFFYFYCSKFTTINLVLYYPCCVE